MFRLILFALVFSPALAAARLGQSYNFGDLRVQVVFTDGRKCAMQSRVQMMEGLSNIPVAEGYTSAEGMIEFSRLAAGTYHLIVSGEGIETSDSGMIEVDSRKTTQSILVTVKRTGEDQGDDRSKTPKIAAAALNIPEGAQKEFSKASEFITKENWKEAIERLLKAVSIYPQYAAAYNNLGVAYGRLGDRGKEREALQRAIDLDDHFASAFVNLAHLDILNRNFASAETLLGKATAADPGNPQTLTLLANVQLLQQHYDDAIANCRKVHALTHDPHALTHYIAARALEHENRLREAAEQLQIFLAEEPSGARADAVRKELASLGKIP
jgi:tetratricopeptide (TPR) repeat protein